MGYSILPSVVKVNNFDRLSDTIRESLSKNVNPLDIDRYISLLEENSIDFDWSGMSMKILNQFFYGGYLADVDISIEEMKHFLRCVRQRKETINNLEQGVTTLKIALAIKKAAQTRKSVNV